jgi:tRNA (cmo5U34)-methyltransferase
MTIGQAFNSTVEYYDDWMKKALPNFTDLFQTAQEIIPFPADMPLRVLDLGAGTGLFSHFVLQKYPQATIVLYDLAEKMLDVAKQRFQPVAHQIAYRIGDYRELREQGAFDLVVSSLSIHHLPDPDKQALFASVYQALRTPGVFLNVDQVRGETLYLRDLYWNRWLEQVHRLEPSVERIQESMDRRTSYDIDATLADQMEWLKAAGFTNADCVYKNFFVGVFFGMKEQR